MFLIKNDRGLYWSETNNHWGDLRNANLYRKRDPRVTAKLTNAVWFEAWAIEELQFARLIAEAEAAGLFEDSDAVKCMCASMDLSMREIANIIDRAQSLFDHTKERIPR